MIIQRKFYHILFCLLIVCPFAGICKHIKATNIITTQVGNKIELFYDLPVNMDTSFVKVYFRKKSSPKTKYLLHHATGSIGIGRFSGKKQKVMWEYKKEPPYLFTGSGFYYEIIVAKKSHPSKDSHFMW